MFFNSSPPVLIFNVVVYTINNHLDFCDTSLNYRIREGIGKKNWEKTIDNIKKYVEANKHFKDVLIENFNPHGEKFYHFVCYIWDPYSNKNRNINITSTIKEGA